jgi:hypothetical protein
MVKTKPIGGGASNRTLVPSKSLTTQSRRDRHISVDLTAEQKLKVIELAELSGLSVADYLRAMVQIAILSNAKYGFQATQLTI